jgi:hypothetical protein
MLPSMSIAVVFASSTQSTSVGNAILSCAQAAGSAAVWGKSSYNKINVVAVKGGSTESFPLGCKNRFSYMKKLANRFVPVRSLGPRTDVSLRRFRIPLHR